MAREWSESAVPKFCSRGTQCGLDLWLYRIKNGLWNLLSVCDFGSVRQEAHRGPPLIIQWCFFGLHHLPGCLSSERTTRFCTVSYGPRDTVYIKWISRFIKSVSCHAIFSFPGVPYDNAPMESFFASLKVEEIHRFRYRSFSDLFTSLQDYFHFYNYQRPHCHMGGLTPVQAEQEYFEK